MAVLLNVVNEKKNEWSICQVKKATASGVCGHKVSSKPKTIITGRVCCGWS